jgi:hypothetical protein
VSPASGPLAATRSRVDGRLRSEERPERFGAAGARTVGKPDANPVRCILQPGDRPGGPYQAARLQPTLDAVNVAGMGSPLVVSLGVEWHDLAPEKAALASVGAELVRLDEMQSSHAPNVVGLLSYGARVTAEDLGRFPNLKVVSVLSTGYDRIELEAAKRLGIAVTTAPGFCTEEVADHPSRLD